ncbi:MAG: DUF1109 family protein [Proteobacteria bacterium]|nr:DUF1109 family protein [Pseudomonadota bacterium]
MKTDEFIEALSADDRKPGPSPGRALALAVVAGVIVAGLLFWAMLGMRPDAMQAMHTVRYDFKIVVSIVLAASASVLVWRFAQPQPVSRQTQLWLLAAPVLLAAAVLIELFVLPGDQWMPKLVGHNARKCMMFIPIFAVVPLGVLLYALRSGATLVPARTGAVAGLIAGGIGAAFYAIHCPDDSPLFVATWYTIAIAAVTALGAFLGSRLLRW